MTRRPQSLNFILQPEDLRLKPFLLLLLPNNRNQPTKHAASTHNKGKEIPPTMRSKWQRRHRDQDCAYTLSHDR
ncbi:hypothetical protein FB466_0901 [Klugiella xanthotipulae]|uniref:Uncharacterized protein n=1 Tax=Klugiella xanthotipulae TaxID=244735 RepID=A0A543I686_9MICO|nr:hypothetical protein FB466_0901 [Klugiella xanthotipulae]